MTSGCVRVVVWTILLSTLANAVSAQNKVRLGVVGQRTERSERYRGVEVMQVFPNTPAEQIGLVARRHVITHVNGDRVRDNEELIKEVGRAPNCKLDLRGVDLTTGEKWEEKNVEKCAAAAAPSGVGRFGPVAPKAAAPPIGRMQPVGPGINNQGNQKLRLGVVGQRTNQSAKYDAVEVMQVFQGMLATRMFKDDGSMVGLQAGRHAIASVNGVKVTTNSELVSNVFAARGGLRLQVVDMRSGERFMLSDSAAPRSAAPGVGRFNPNGPVRPPQQSNRWPARIPVRLPNGISAHERNFDLTEQGEWEPQLVIDTGGFQGAIVSSVEFSPDGKLLAAGADVVRIWDVQSKKLLHTLRGQREFGGAGYCSDLAWSDDGEYLAVAVTGFKSSLRIYSRSSGFAKIEDVLGGHDGHIDQVAFSPDGKTMATAGVDNEIHIWNWKTRRKTQSYRTEQPVSHLAFPCGDPNLLAITGDGNVYYWSYGNDQLADDSHRERIHQLYRELPVTRNGQVDPRAVSIHLDPNWSVVGIFDSESHKGKYLSTVWEPGATKPLARHRHSHYVTAVTLHQKSGLAASADALGEVELWSLKTGDTLAEFVPSAKPVYAVKFESDSVISFGRKMSGDKWGWNTYGYLTHRLDFGRSLLRERGEALPSPYDKSATREVSVQRGQDLIVKREGRVESNIPMGRSGMWRPNSYRLLTGEPLGFRDAVAVGLNNGIVAAYEPGNLLVKRTFLGHTGPVWGIAQSGDGRLMATGSSDGTIRIWSLDPPQRDGEPGLLHR